MKQKLISLILGIFLGMVIVSTAFSVPKLIDYSYSDMKIIYMGEELDLSNEKLLNVTTWAYPKNDEMVYVPVAVLMDSLGYYYTWDSFQKAVIVSRDEEDIKAIKLRDTIDSSYNGMIIKNASVNFLNSELNNSKWYMNNQKCYISYEFMPGNKFEYIYKNHNEKGFDVNKGTYSFEEGAIVFNSDKKYHANEYGEMIAFANNYTPEKIRVKINEGDKNTIYIGFSANTQNFIPFVKES